jgi:hypothetical protein
MLRRALVVAVIVLGGGVAMAQAQLAPDELAKKNDGGYFTGLPLLNYTTDTGLGYGARAYYYYDGARSDPRFATTPYLYRVFLQAFASTNGLQYHWLDFDAPKIGDTPYRVRSQLIFERNTASNYFGIGDQSLGKLSFPAISEQFTDFTTYSNALEKVFDGKTYERFNQYDLIRPIWIASIERLFFHDRIRTLAGFGFSYAKINDYTNHLVPAEDDNGNSIKAVEAPTRLAIDCGYAGQPGPAKIVGCGGGWDNFIRLGVSYDTRDYEPDPKHGVFLEGALDIGTIALGSQYDYARAMMSARGFWSPFPQNIVFAGRAVFEYETSGTPFFSMDTIPFTDDPRTGLGGNRTLRGYRQDRFVGPVSTLLNGEVRWTWGHKSLWGQKFAFFLVPFVEAGRVYDHLSELTYRDWKPAYGGAFRIAWNLATIISVDYGFSPEDNDFYVNFNHMF